MHWDLSPEELRVLGSLVEKESTTPEQYPLSVNALRSACNQKSSREPVMALSEADVREALTSLSRRGLVRTASGYGGRVSRFAHRFGQSGTGVELDAAQRAVLCLLMLRGAQTVGELRARTARLHEFGDAGAVEATVQGLIEHPEGPLVRRLEREPGRRESRYVHCLGAVESGPDVDQAPTEAAPPAGSASDLEARVAALEEQLEEMRARIDGITGERD